MQYIVLDATFKVVPKNFEHLLIVQENFNNRKFVLFYCIMQKKNEEAYLKVLEILQKNIKNFKTKWIVVDLEQALSCFRQKIFLNSDVYSCLFYFNRINLIKINDLSYFNLL